MKKATQFLFLIIALVFTTSAIAQSTVTGTVIDTETNGPLPGANVVEKGTSNGTTTDFDGKFTLTTQSSSGEIEISYVGFGTKSMAFSGSQNLGNITVASDNTLDEVVIIGKGIIDLAGGRDTPVAVSTVRAKEIQARAVGNVELPEIIKNTPSVFVSQQMVLVMVL